MWGAIIAAGASIASGIIGQEAALQNKKAVRKAARKNYNTMMANSRAMEKSVYENMTSYERDAAEYRSTMFQRTMANGGIRADESTKDALAEIKGYEFGVDKINTDEEAYGEIEKYNGATGKQWYNKSYQAYYETKRKASADEKNNEALYNALMNYQGRTAEFTAGGDNTALLINRQSVKDLQEDLNKTYVQGMTEVLQQRQAAQNAWQSMETQATMYQIQGMQSLWNGLLGAAQYGAQAYGELKSNKSTAPKITNGGGIATKQYGQEFINK